MKLLSSIIYKNRLLVNIPACQQVRKIRFCFPEGVVYCRTASITYGGVNQMMIESAP